jgi:phosphohistidine phosphatase SixA
LESLLKHVQYRISSSSSKVAKFRTFAIATALVTLVASFFIQARQTPDLAHGDPAQIADLRAHWRNGDMIVLVRHVERCDHSDAPCLEGSDGITARAQDVASEVGQEFQRLGLESADIYSSPLTRARQTAKFMFNSTTEAQDWLIQCKGTMLRDMLRHKEPQRNLILVTHSECIDQFEQDMHLPDGKTAAYGSSLFVYLDKANAAPRVLGHINAQDWQSVFPR